MSENTSRLVVQNLQKSFKKRQVVKSFSLEIESGEVIGLLGPNGAGKTTSFYMIVGLIAADAGSVTLDGQELRHLPIHERARLGVGYLPQEASIFRKMTVEQNIRAILEISTKDKSRIDGEVEKLLADLNIGHLRHNPAPSLSGGERRRVEIARVLAMQPRFILLDEPCRRRPHCRHRHPKNHRLPQIARHRRTHYRPQRTRNPQHLRQGLHHQRRHRPRLRQAGRLGQQRTSPLRLSRRKLQILISNTDHDKPHNQLCGFFK